MTSGMPEGSPSRRWARSCLLESAAVAKAAGHSYYEWQDDIAEQEHLNCVTQRDLDAIFALVWEGDFRGRRR